MQSDISVIDVNTTSNRIDLPMQYLNTGDWAYCTRMY